MSRPTIFRYNNIDYSPRELVELFKTMTLGEVNIDAAVGTDTEVGTEVNKHEAQKITLVRIHCGDIALLEIEVGYLDDLSLDHFNEIYNIISGYGLCNFKISDERQSIIAHFKHMSDLKKLLVSKERVIENIAALID